jgi:hypothetical protein
MDNYGQPRGPETAMLDELHTLWGRTFGRGEEERRTGVPVAVLAVVLVMVTAVISVAWVLI